MSIHSMHHAGFIVQDLERARAFYCEVLGLSLVWDRRGVPTYTSRVMGIPDAQTHGLMVEAPGGQRLELLSFERPRLEEMHDRAIGYGSAHICFQVDDIADIYDRLVANGATVIHPPVEVDLDMGRITGCYARDPEGNWLEFLQIAEK